MYIFFICPKKLAPGSRGQRLFWETIFNRIYIDLDWYSRYKSLAGQYNFSDPIRCTDRHRGCLRHPAVCSCRAGPKPRRKNLPAAGNPAGRYAGRSGIHQWDRSPGREYPVPLYNIGRKRCKHIRLRTGQNHPGQYIPLPRYHRFRAGSSRRWDLRVHRFRRRGRP